MNVTLDWGTILTTIAFGMVGFVWNTLKAQIDTKVGVLQARIDDKVTDCERQWQSAIVAVNDKIGRHEVGTNSLVADIRALAEAIRRIELNLANNHPTKEELKAAVDIKNPRLRHIEDMLMELQAYLPRNPSRTSSKTRD